MKIAKKITLVILFFITCVLFAFGVYSLNGVAFAYTDSIALASTSGDAFKTLDINFEKTSFEYSATVNFNSGDAAALTFGENDKGVWALNLDRVANRVKLLYFAKGENGGATAREIMSEHYIGNDKMSRAEIEMVAPKVRHVAVVYLKAVITVDGNNIYLECYVDGIRRFAFKDGSQEGVKLNLNKLANDMQTEYNGGKIGFNVCNSDVKFSDIEYGEHTYSYYTELYRNKFHFSPFSRWNNDPNGLVYYNGYYHMFYQTYPFDKLWGDMYWGHARSKDLLRWENLPICLYPERGIDGAWGAGDGFMWSGSARIYHKGESEAIDNSGWFNDISQIENGKSVGLIAFYTRDGARQDQMLMTSSDGGLTWDKRKYIPSQEILGLGQEKTDCRDPKVFEYDYNDNGNVRRVYGMLLTGMKDPFNVWFLKSENLVDWYKAGGFSAKVPLTNTTSTNGPECPDIAFFNTSDGRKCVITLSGRGYIVGDLTYNGNEFAFSVGGKNVAEMPLNEIPVQQMDFGPDSYATQTFYIEDGEFANKTISVSWLSGVPGASASVNSGLLTDLRSRWNCGMTIPVEWGLVKEGAKYILTQTPVIKNGKTNKIQLASVKDKKVNNGDNLLKNLKATTFELDAKIDNPEGGKVVFRIRVGEGEYTEIGWNRIDGYYVDRRNTASGNLTLPNYNAKYTAKTHDMQSLSFYILCDDGSVEVFCGDGKYPFYTVTFANPNSEGMYFECEKEITFTKLLINKINSAWANSTPATYLRVGCDKVELDLTLTKQKDIVIESSQDFTIELTEGEGIVTYKKTPDGIKLISEKAGNGILKITCGSLANYVDISVLGGKFENSDCAYGEILAGDWYLSDEGYKGRIKDGDGFIMSSQEDKNFIYSAKFDIQNGIAAALVFRANEDKSKYITVNYDHGAGLVKLWSSNDPKFDNEEDSKQDRAKREIKVRLNDLTGVILTVKAIGKHIEVYLNDRQYIDYTYTSDIPTEGRFGLNICAATVQFKSIAITPLSEEKYTGGDIVWNHIDGAAFTVVNRNLNNKLVDSGFYKVEGRRVTLYQNYMASLPKTGEYVFEIRGVKSLYHIKVDVGEIPKPIWGDVTLQKYSNATFFVGGLIVDKVILNGSQLDKTQYKIQNMYITIDNSQLRQGENILSIGELSAKITVEEIPQLKPNFNKGNWGVVYTVLFTIVGAAILAETGFILYLTILKGKKKNGGND